MVKKKKPARLTRRIAWHPGYVAATKLDLKKYADYLTYLEEFQLTTEPLS